LAQTVSCDGRFPQEEQEIAVLAARW